MKRHNKLAKLNRELLEAQNEMDAALIREEINELEKAQRRHERFGRLPSEIGCGYGGFEDVDPNYKWEDWN